MKIIMDMRTVEVNRNGIWKAIDFKKLNKGDNFKMFEPTGEPVIDNNNNTVFYSTSEPYKNENGIWQIDVME
jgi:hypothetical protein